MNLEKAYETEPKKELKEPKRLTSDSGTQYSRITFNSDNAGPSFITPCNFTRNYAVYWSQLTTNSQCSLRPVS